MIKNVKFAGVTLIELMVVIAVAAILFSVVAPSAQRLSTNSFSDRLAREIELDLRYARSQASTLAHEIHFRPLNNWQGGWEVFDKNENEVLRTRSHTLDNGTITSTTIATATPIAFQPNGRTNAEAQVKIEVKGCTGDRIRTFHINRIGQVQLTGASQCP